MARTAPEKAVERAVDRALAAFGYRVVRFSQARASRQTPGIPDRLAFGHGHAVWIECKAVGGVLSTEQIQWHADARAAGQTVLVARSAADLVEPLKALGAPIA